MAVSAIWDGKSSQLPASMSLLNPPRPRHATLRQSIPHNIDPMEPSSILKHLPIFGVLLCTACSEPHCLPPGSVEKYMRDFHSTIFHRKQRATLIEYSESSHIKLNLKQPNDVIIPPRENGRVEGLHLHEDGWECLQCGYVCGAEITMKTNHCRPEHGWVDGKPSIWKKQSIQVYFHSSLQLIYRLSLLQHVTASISPSIFQKINKRAHKLLSKHYSNARH